MTTITPTHIRIREGCTDVPDVVFDHAETLEILDMSGNRLSQLPARMADLTALQILFLSDNEFEHIPEVLAACPSLDTIAFKSNRIATLHPGHLPERTRWLMLTNNRIAHLTPSFGRFTKLRKCALAGNRLVDLPDEMAACRDLELIRVSANALTSPPHVLFDLPNLAWVSFSGNEFDPTGASAVQRALPSVRPEDVQIMTQLGKGASGTIHEVLLENRPAALKSFSGDITSDGARSDELILHARAGRHDNLIEPLGLMDSGDGEHSLLMALVPATYRPLGQPPSLETCTRDTFAAGTFFTGDDIRHVSGQVARAMHHLHARSIAHGDLYAHNVMVGTDNHVFVCDFGAASDLESLPTDVRKRVEAIEVRAFGNLVDDLLSCHRDARSETDLVALSAACRQEDPGARPTFRDLVLQLVK